MDRIVIVGAGGFGREVLALLRDINAAMPRWTVVGFVDDRAELVGRTVAGLPVVGTVDAFARGRLADHYVLGVGDPVGKRKLAERLATSGLHAPTLIHPSVVRSESVRVADGGILCAGGILTCDIELRRFVALHMGCTVGHDVVIDDFCFVGPGANISGTVTIGAGVWVGTGAAIVQGYTVGEWSVIGAGAAVASDLPANCTAVGIPARPIKHRPVGWHLT